MSWSRHIKAAQPPLAATASQPEVPATPGERITSLEVLEGDTYQPLDPVKTYRVVTNSFMFNGGDGYAVFTAGGDLADPSVGGATNRLDTGLIDADVIKEYIESQPGQLVSPQIEGRITVRYLVQLPFVSKGAAAVPAAFESAAD